MTRKACSFFHETLPRKSSSPEPFPLGKYPNIWKSDPLIAFDGTFASGPFEVHLILVEIKGCEASWRPGNSALASSTPRRGTMGPLGSEATFSFLFYFVSLLCFSLASCPSSSVIASSAFCLSLAPGGWQNPQLALPFAKAAPTLLSWFSSAVLIH